MTADSWNDLTSFEITDEIDPFLTSVIFYLKAMGKDSGTLSGVWLTSVLTRYFSHTDSLNYILGERQIKQNRLHV